MKNWTNQLIQQRIMSATVEVIHCLSNYSDEKLLNRIVMTKMMIKRFSNYKLDLAEFSNLKLVIFLSTNE